MSFQNYTNKDWAVCDSMEKEQTGETEPFDLTDDIDFVIITTKSAENFGQFVLPKQVLADKGIITQKGKEGKRGIRVYPPWDVMTDKQVKKKLKVGRRNILYNKKRQCN